MLISTAPRVKLEEICNLNPSSCIVETAGGYAIVQPDLPTSDGARLLIACFGTLQFAAIQGGVIITEDGEAIEDDASEDVRIVGVVTFFINGAGAYTDDMPCM